MMGYIMKKRQIAIGIDTTGASFHVDCQPIEELSHAWGKPSKEDSGDNAQDDPEPTGTSQTETIPSALSSYKLQLRTLRISSTFQSFRQFFDTSATYGNYFLKDFSLQYRASHSGFFATRFKVQSPGQQVGKTEKLFSPSTQHSMFLPRPLNSK